MRKGIILGLILLIALAAVGCGDEAEEATTTAAPTTTAAATTTEATTTTGGEVALTITGAVTGQTSFTMADLEALGVETLTLDHPKDGPREFTGVRLTSLLEAAGVDATATTLTFIAADGYESDIPLADVLACADCLMAFDDGTLRAAMSGMDSKAWAKEVVEIAIG
jgi:hypothetical protein